MLFSSIIKLYDILSMTKNYFHECFNKFFFILVFLTRKRNTRRNASRYANYLLVLILSLILFKLCIIKSIKLRFELLVHTTTPCQKLESNTKMQVKNEKTFQYLFSVKTKICDTQFPFFQSN